jgi:8-oxo-dGTP pyrophosphatase MutT (NUDIX family)
LEKHQAIAAGGVVFRRTAGGVEFLVGEQIDWRTHEHRVRLPKGHVDPGETVEAAAVREVEEETGRKVVGATPLGEHRYSFVAPPRRKRPGGLIEKVVVFFLMEDAGPTDAPRDDEMERILWLDADSACQRLTFENEQTMVRRAAEKLEGR